MRLPINMPWLALPNSSSGGGGGATTATRKWTQLLTDARFTKLLAGLTCMMMMIVAWCWAPSPRGVTLSAADGSGICNQLLAVAVLLTQAKEDGHAVYLWGEWMDFAVMNVDVDEIRKFHPVELIPWNFADAFSSALCSIGLSVNGMKQVTMTRTCGDKTSMRLLRDYLRPSQEFRMRGEYNVQDLKTRGAELIISVHMRDYEHYCPYKAVAGYDMCHLSSKYQQRDEANAKLSCQYGWTESFVRAVTQEWPELTQGVAGGRKLGLLLSTDSQRPDADATFENAGVFTAINRGEGAVPGITTTVRSNKVLIDMWSSTLADFYVGNPMSSCDAIVAQWRHGKNIFPRLCFEGFGNDGVEDPLCTFSYKCPTWFLCPEGLSCQFCPIART